MAQRGVAPEPSSAILAARTKWRWTGADRPPWAEPAGPGQESVWDYPRPPSIVAEPRRVQVRLGDDLLADTTDAVRVLETAGAPAFYLPRGDVQMGLLVTAEGSSLCEWKGHARYWAPAAKPDRIVGWDYPNPFEEMARLAGMLSFYPAALDCTVAGETVRAQPGGFYGGWVTSEVVGPIKGEPGSGAW